MPGLMNGLEPEKKRKRKDDPLASSKRKRVVAQDASQELSAQDELLGLEEQILESRTNYNSIQTLINCMRTEDSANGKDVLAAIALCRVFCRLIVAGNLSKPSDKSSNEATIVQWLRERLQDYENELLSLLKDEDVGRQSTALTLLMRLIKEESAYLYKSEEAIWRDGLFGRILGTLVDYDVAEDTKREFVEKYMEEYDDVRYYALALLAYVPVWF